MNKFSLTLAVVALLGTGCVSVDTQVFSPEEAAKSLSISSGSEIVLRETVFGLGGKFVSFFNQKEGERTIFVDEWSVNQNATLRWQSALQKETEASKIATKEYYAKFAAAPIGTELPKLPKPQYETTTQAGALATQALAESTDVLLPIFWSETQTDGEGTSLIWLSKKQYDELIQTRRTSVNLGLFDDSVLSAVGLTDQVKYVIERIKGSDAVAEEKSVLEINAEIDWTNYTLSINGVPTVVRAIHAQNAFARYTILANQDNPLILELMLSPAARGSLNLFSRKALGDAFWGFEVVGITRGENAESNADQPQHSNQ
jgi:hypothetical protein